MSAMYAVDAEQARLTNVKVTRLTLVFMCKSAFVGLQVGQCV